MLLASASPNVVSGPDQDIDDESLEGKKTVYSYDSSGNLTRIDYPEFNDDASFGGTSHNAFKSFTYNSYGQVTYEYIYLDTQLLRKVRYDYYPTGNSKSLLEKVIVDPDGLALTTQYSYNSRRDLVSVTDPRGKTTTYEREGDGLVTAVLPPGGASLGAAWYYYDACGNLLQLKRGSDTDTYSTQHYYDALSRQVKVRRQVTQTVWIETTTQYDAKDRAFSITEPGNKKTRFVYDWVNVPDAFPTGSSPAYLKRTRKYLSGAQVSEFLSTETYWDGAGRLNRRYQYVDYSAVTKGAV